MNRVHAVLVGAIFAVVSTGLQASAGETSQKDLRALLLAKSVAEFESKQNEQIRSHSSTESCEAQLKARAIPRDCFRSLLKGSNEFGRITRICVANARLSRSRLDLSRLPGDTSLLSAPCLEAIGERLEDLHYIDESQSPELSVARTSGINLEE